MRLKVLQATRLGLYVFGPVGQGLWEGIEVAIENARCGEINNLFDNIWVEQSKQSLHRHNIHLFGSYRIPPSCRGVNDAGHRCQFFGKAIRVT